MSMTRRRCSSSTTSRRSAGAARAVVDRADGFELVGEAASGEEAVATGRRPASRPGADGHQPARHQRHRGDAPDRGSPRPTTVVFLLLDVPARRPSRPTPRRAGRAPTSTRKTFVARSDSLGCGSEHADSVGFITEQAASSGIDPRTVTPTPGVESQRTVPPMAPTRSAMLTKPWPCRRDTTAVSKPATVVGHRRTAAHPTPPIRAPSTGAVARCVLGRVLQRLETAEVDGRLDLGA